MTMTIMEEYSRAHWYQPCCEFCLLKEDGRSLRHKICRLAKPPSLGYRQTLNAMGVTPSASSTAPATNQHKSEDGQQEVLVPRMKAEDTGCISAL